MRGGRRSTLLLPLLAGAACVGPQVSDQLGFAGLVLPAYTIVPSLYDDPAVATAIATAAGFTPTIPLLAGFAGGKPAAYWDLGPAPLFADPAFILAHREGDVLVPLPHPPIFGHLPGNTGYSPYRRLFYAEITDTYAGEVIPSVAALNEAQARGLVGPGKGSRDGRDWPVAPAGVVVTGGGAPGSGATGEAKTFYFNGQAGTFFDFGLATIASGPETIPALDLYLLSREGGEVLSEPARSVDMDGDGDTFDTNNVFAAQPGDAAYSPRCQEVNVTVGTTVASIDTSKDQTQADIKAAAQLVAGAVPVTPPVVALRPGERVFNCPQRAE